MKRFFAISLVLCVSGAVYFGLAQPNALQAQIEELADQGGGVLQLQPGATYIGVTLTMPYTATGRYDNIKIRGVRSKLVGVPGFPLIDVGNGGDWHLTRLKGFELSGCDLDLQGLDVRLEWTEDALIEDCRVANSAREAIISGGGSVRTRIRNTHGKNCGYGHPAGARSLFNVGGLFDEVTFCSAEDCALFAELAGFGTRITHCRMVRSPITIGNGGYGISDIEISHCRLEQSGVTAGNVLGKLGDIRLLHNVFTDSVVEFCGFNPVNAHAIPPSWQFSDKPSQVVGNTFIGGSALVLDAYYANQQTGPLVFAKNYVDCAENSGIVIQSHLTAPVRIESNDFTQRYVGQMQLSGPGGEIPDHSSQLQISRNRGPAGAYLWKHPVKIYLVPE